MEREGWVGGGSGGGACSIAAERFCAHCVNFSTCVTVQGYQRERKRERDSERERVCERENKRERNREAARERETGRRSVCVREKARERENERGSAEILHSVNFSTCITVQSVG